MDTIHYSAIVKNMYAFESDTLQMDPLLQRIIAFSRSGKKRNATASTGETEVAVVAKVADAASWLQLTEVSAGVEIGKVNEGEGVIVTGRIPIKRIEHIRKLPFVQSLKAARRISTTLKETIADMEAGKNVPATLKAVHGKGVIVGIVDFGCGFAHKNFLTTTGKSRLLALWDQGGATVGEGVKYGRLYKQADINKSLVKQNPYQALGYFPGAKAHGTHVMDIACGNGRGTGVAGVAPQADIIFVELDSSDTPDFGTESVGKNFGDSVHLLEAVKFIFEQAGDQPCVINLSLGTNGGPHDGTTLVEQGIDSLLAEKPNRAVVIAASNSFADGIHAAGNIAAKKSVDLQWRVSPNDDTENEMEIWYTGKGQISVEIIDPSGKSLGVIEPGESGTERNADGTIRLFVANRLDDPNNHDNMIGLWLKDGMPGTWKVRLKNKQNNPVAFHTWIERDDFGDLTQSSFAEPHDNTHTLGSISCSQLSIAVGSYDAHRQTKPLSFFSSAGPTRDGRKKPEVSAPGHAVVAADSSTTSGTVQMSGTSMAAPAVAGAIAVLLGEAKRKGKKLSIGTIRDIVTKATNSNPPIGTDWHDRYGFGRLSLKKMLGQL